MTTYAALVGPEYDPIQREDDDGNPIGPPVKRWLNGVKFTPFGCERVVGDVFDPCVLRERDDPQSFPEEVEFLPFLMEVGVNCTTLTADATILRNQMIAYITAHMEVSRSSLIGQQVMQGAFSPTNPSLMSEAQVITGADESLLGALEAVEDGLADLLDGGQGMIHMPASILMAATSGGGFRFITGPDGISRYYSAAGHIIVADAGYAGPSPNANAIVDGEVWIYGSGPIFVKLDDVININGAPWEEIDLTRNVMEVNGSQFALAIFEPCSVVAAVVDVSTSAADLEEE
jgi:hypothetical protein